MNGTKFLLDTNVVIGRLMGTATALQLLADHGVILGNAAISQITRIELLGFPSITPDEEIAIKLWLGNMEVHGLNEYVESAAIAVRRRRRLKLPDAIVFATALAHRSALLTLDENLKSAFDDLKQSQIWNS